MIFIRVCRSISDKNTQSEIAERPKFYSEIFMFVSKHAIRWIMPARAVAYQTYTHTPKVTRRADVDAAKRRCLVASIEPDAFLYTNPRRVFAPLINRTPRVVDADFMQAYAFRGFTEQL